MSMNFCLVVIFSQLKIVTSLYMGADFPCVEQHLTFTEDTSLMDLNFNGTVVISGTADNRMECSAMCGAQSTCMSFVYNDISRSCVAFTEQYSVAEYGYGESGARYYKLPLRPGCPSDYTYNAPLNFCYKVNRTKLNKHDAKAVCTADGGQLAKIDSQARQNMMTAALEVSYDPLVSNKYVINGDQSSGQWKYDDGTPMTVFFWGATSQYNAIYMYHDNGYLWKTSWTSNKRMFVCEVVL